MQERFGPNILGLIKTVPSFKNQSLLFTVKKDFAVLGNYKLRVVKFTVVPIVNLVVVTVKRNRVFVNKTGILILNPGRCRRRAFRRGK
ncbi:hypothetical protein D3C74_426840 [compost metagenome]